MYMKAKPSRKRGASRGLSSRNGWWERTSKTEEPKVPNPPKKDIHTEKSLLKLTNSKLRDLLSGFDGAPSGVGNTKSELVALILDAQG